MLLLLLLLLRWRSAHPAKNNMSLRALSALPLAAQNMSTFSTRESLQEPCIFTINCTGQQKGASVSVPEHVDDQHYKVQ
jgi:hypothetical protein